MIAAALLLIGVQSWSFDFWAEIPPTPVVTPLAPDELVVSGKRIRKLTAKVRTDRKTGAVSCELKRPSGNPRLDAALCEVGIACNVRPVRRKALAACMSERVPPVMERLYPDHGKAVPRSTQQ